MAGNYQDYFTYESAKCCLGIGGEVTTCNNCVLLRDIKDISKDTRFDKIVVRIGEGILEFKKSIL